MSMRLTRMLCQSSKREDGIWSADHLNCSAEFQYGKHKKSRTPSPFEASARFFPKSDRHYGTVIFRICPVPREAGRIPMFETYRFPSGPNVITVGNDNAEVAPSAMTVYLFLPSTLRILAVFGVGTGLPVVFCKT